MIHVESIEQFDKEITTGTSLVDFYATWCGPCRMIAPILEEIEEENLSKIKVLKVDVDELSEIASRYSINAIPAILLFKDGELKKTSVGFAPKEQITSLVLETLGE